MQHWRSFFEAKLGHGTPMFFANKKLSLCINGPGAQLSTHSPPSAPCTTVFKFQPIVSPSQTPLDKTNGHGGALAIRTKKKESG
jgi:hypothetical protein